MQKLIFFDIDGTVLTEGDNRYVPQSTIDAVRMLRENGHFCFINTGRAWSEIHDNIASLQFDGFVCGCGTYINYHDEILLAHEIPIDLADSVYEKLHTCHLEWMLEGQHTVYYSTLPYQSHMGDFHREYHTLFPEKCTDFPPTTRGLRYDKFCICTTPDSNLSEFTDTFKEDFTFIDRGNGFFEVVPAGYSKASGMQFLMDYLKISRQNTIAIGDSTNDLPMLEFAGLSIGMKKSDAIVLDTVDYVTDTVENDGIYKAMKHYHLI